MKKNPLISVIMPAYNAEKYIRSAIDSILNQTYQNIELIIVEDVSTDDTLQIISEYKDPRVKVFRNEVNQGISYSTNYAIRQSSGEYIALMDDDDIAVRDRLQLSLDFFEAHEDVDIVGGAGLVIDENDKFVGNHMPRNNPNLLKAILLFHDCMWNGSVMIRREVFFEHNIWYRENCYGMQDFLFFVEASKKVKIANMSDILLYWRKHASSETSIEMDQNTKLRAEKYARIQRDSILESGFSLTEKQYDLITTMLTEKLAPSYKKEDWYALSEVFSEMISQAKNRNLEWKNELEWLCKKILGERLPRVEWF